MYKNDSKIVMSASFMEDTVSFRRVDLAKIKFCKKFNFEIAMKGRFAGGS